MNNTITITVDELAATQERSYQAGFVMGEVVGKQNESFAQGRAGNKRVLEVCDLITHELLKNLVEANK